MIYNCVFPVKNGAYFIHNCTATKDGRYLEIFAQYKDDRWAKFIQDLAWTNVLQLNHRNYIGSGTMPSAYDLIGARIRVNIDKTGKIQWYVEWIDEDFRSFHLYDNLPVEGLDISDLDQFFK